MAAGGGFAQEPPLQCDPIPSRPVKWMRGSEVVSFPYPIPPNNSASEVPYTFTGEVCAAQCTTVTYRVTVAPGQSASAGGSACSNRTIITPYLDGDQAVTDFTFNSKRYLAKGFGSNQIVVAQIDVPNVSGSTRVKIYEHAGGAATNRKAWLSELRCGDRPTGRPYLQSDLGSDFRHSCWDYGPNER